MWILQYWWVFQKQEMKCIFFNMPHTQAYIGYIKGHSRTNLKVTQGPRIIFQTLFTQTNKLISYTFNHDTIFDTANVSYLRLSSPYFTRKEQILYQFHYQSYVPQTSFFCHFSLIQKKGSNFCQNSFPRSYYYPLHLIFATISVSFEKFIYTKIQYMYQILIFTPLNNF